PYEIKLAQANAQLETASARLALANRELHRAQELAAKAFGTEQTVDQRTADRASRRGRRQGANPRRRVRSRALPHHGPLHWAHWHALGLGWQPHCWQPRRNQSDDAAGYDRFA